MAVCLWLVMVVAFVAMVVLGGAFVASRVSALLGALVSMAF